MLQILLHAWAVPCEFAPCPILISQDGLNPLLNWILNLRYSLE